MRRLGRGRGGTSYWAYTRGFGLESNRDFEDH